MAVSCWCARRSGSTSSAWCAATWRAALARISARRGRLRRATAARAAAGRRTARANLHASHQGEDWPRSSTSRSKSEERGGRGSGPGDRRRQPGDLSRRAATMPWIAGSSSPIPRWSLACSMAELILIDELLTPDSSRFWAVGEYAPGGSPPSFDKQYVRDWLERSGLEQAASRARPAAGGGGGDGAALSRGAALAGGVKDKTTEDAEDTEARTAICRCAACRAGWGALASSSRTILAEFQSLWSLLGPYRQRTWIERARLQILTGNEAGLPIWRTIAAMCSVPEHPARMVLMCVDNIAAGMYRNQPRMPPLSQGAAHAIVLPWRQPPRLRST